MRFHSCRPSPNIRGGKPMPRRSEPFSKRSEPPGRNQDVGGRNRPMAAKGANNRPGSKASVGKVITAFCYSGCKRRSYCAANILATHLYKPDARVHGLPCDIGVGRTVELHVIN